jgi:hypothetical protein
MGRNALDTLYELLASERRRLALGVLVDADGPLGRVELARRIAGRRRDDRNADAVGEAAANEVAISLGHVHLPKLEAGGLVDRTGDDRYAVTELGRYVECAACAFETSLASVAEAFAGELRPSAARRRAVSPAEDDDDC